MQSPPTPGRLKNSLPLAAVLFAALAALLFVLTLLTRRLRSDASFDFFATALLYSMTVLNVTLLLVVFFVLARNLIRAFLESRRGVVGARLRLRLVLALLVMGLAPAGVLIAVGASLIREGGLRGMSFDAEGVVASSRLVIAAAETERQKATRAQAAYIASELSRRQQIDKEDPLTALASLVEDADFAILTDASATAAAIFGASPLTQAQVSMLHHDAMLRGVSELEIGQEGTRTRVCAHRVGKVDDRVVIVARSPVGNDLELMSKLSQRLDTFQKLRAVRAPLSSIYLSLFLFPALLTLVGAVWLPFVWARRFARPLRNVSLAAERIAQGERGVQVAPDETDEEFKALISSFNRMSERLARSEEEVAFSRADLTKKNAEIEERRRLVEAIFETVGTGIVVVDSGGALSRMNSMAARLLGIDTLKAVGQPFAQVLPKEAAEEFGRVLRRVLDGRSASAERDATLIGSRGRREVKLTAVPLPLEGGRGAIVALDDVTPLMQAQRVAAWGEVARKLAHEIKNPLTPIKLSAQRVRKAHLKGAPDFDRVLGESTEAIVSEVDALQNLVDEFAHFARLPPSRLAEGSLNGVVEGALMLYETAYPGVSITRDLASDLPAVRLDGAQLKRVVINLIDNAIDAMGEKGSIVVATCKDDQTARARLTIADDGPGVPSTSRETIFLPNFSTKRKGSGLGLAIARRIVEDHGGEIRVEDQEPKGARFVVDLPL